MRILLTLTLCLAPLIISNAQEQDRPLRDRWRGLVIGRATPEDAVKVLGQPAKDKESGPRT